MNGKKKRIVAVLALIVVAAMTTAGVLVFAEQGAVAAASDRSGATMTSFLSKVAKSLGLEELRLTQAIQTAHEQTIDEALAAGRITEERAQAMKARLTAEKAMDELIVDGIAAGKITQDQADLMGGRRGGLMLGGRSPGRDGAGGDLSDTCGGPMGWGRGR
jgi:hypothetical protein